MVVESARPTAVLHPNAPRAQGPSIVRLAVASMRIVLMMLAYPVDAATDRVCDRVIGWEAVLVPVVAVVVSCWPLLAGPATRGVHQFRCDRRLFHRPGLRVDAFRLFVCGDDRLHLLFRRPADLRCRGRSVRREAGDGEELLARALKRAALPAPVTMVPSVATGWRPLAPSRAHPPENRSHTVPHLPSVTAQSHVPSEF